MGTNRGARTCFRATMRGRGEVGHNNYQIGASSPPSFPNSPPSAPFFLPSVRLLFPCPRQRHSPSFHVCVSGEGVPSPALTQVQLV